MCALDLSTEASGAGILSFERMVCQSSIGKRKKGQDNLFNNGCRESCSKHFDEATMRLFREDWNRR